MLNIFDPSVVIDDIGVLIGYIPITLGLTAAAGIVGLILGFLLAIIRTRRVVVLHQIAGVFISLMRGTPILVQLYVTYFGIPILIKYINYYQNKNIQIAEIPAILYAIVALALNNAAFCSVIIQSSLEAVDKGEIEAAIALGMTGPQIMFRIILPESAEIALPSLGNQIIGLVKGTSLAFTCGVVEMTAEGKLLGARGYRYFEAYVALAILYWVITIVLEQIIRLVMNRVRVPDVVGKEGKTAEKNQKNKGGVL